jgi:hypothetical protein
VKVIVKVKGRQPLHKNISAKIASELQSKFVQAFLIPYKHLISKDLSNLSFTSSGVELISYNTRMKYILYLSCLAISIQGYAQELNAHSLDFWVGSWNLSWTNAQGDTIHGYNHIERILNNKVIQENFADSTRGFYGKSWSTYNPKTKNWQQVWTDSNGGMLQFTGAQYGDSLAFEMAPILLNGKQVIRRMLFYNISESNFTWDWQSAEVGKQNWQLLWRIRYTRAE